MLYVNTKTKTYEELKNLQLDTDGIWIKLRFLMKFMLDDGNFIIVYLTASLRPPLSNWFSLMTMDIPRSEHNMLQRVGDTES